MNKTSRRLTGRAPFIDYSTTKPVVLGGEKEKPIVKRTAMWRKVGNTLLVLLGILIAIYLYFYTPDIPVEELRAKYADDASQFMPIAGMQVHYKDEGHGMPLVLLHGTGSSLHAWDAWADSLRAHHRLIRYTLPSFGLTGPHPKHDYSMAAHVAVLDTLLRRLGVDSCYIGGNSLGGLIACHYLAKGRVPVHKLLLINANGLEAGRKQPLVWKLFKVPLLNRVLAYSTPRTLVARTLTDAFADPGRIPPDLLDRYVDLNLRQGNRLAMQQRIRQEHVLPVAELALQQIPVLIMWGAHDPWLPLAHSYAFNDLFQNSSLIVYDDLGNLPHEELPYRTLASALDFFAGRL